MDDSGVEDVVIGGATIAAAAIHLGSQGSATFNEQGNDFDFRVEGQSDTDLLVVDASADMVGISELTPTATLDIGGGSLTTIDGTNDLLVLDSVEIDGSLYIDGSGITATDATFTNIGRLTPGDATFTSIDSTTIGKSVAAPATVSLPLASVSIHLEAVKAVSMLVAMFIDVKDASAATDLPMVVESIDVKVASPGVSLPILVNVASVAVIPEPSM